MIIEYNKMNKLIGNKDLARAMDGMVISGGYEGFLKIHDVILHAAPRTMMKGKPNVTEWLRHCVPTTTLTVNHTLITN
jgi:hypothetical protein